MNVTDMFEQASKSFLTAVDWIKKAGTTLAPLFFHEFFTGAYLYF
jgi:hypothetical protein